MSGFMHSWITAKLQADFSPSFLEVIDESADHAGHNAQARDSGETHFRVRMVTPAFAGLSRVEQHRRVNASLAEALKGSVHALALEVSAA
jgi:BolA protein